MFQDGRVFYEIEVSVKRFFVTFLSFPTIVLSLVAVADGGRAIDDWCCTVC